MSKFDAYTKSIITEALGSPIQDSDGGLPKNPKKGQVYVDKFKRKFVWDGKSWNRQTPKKELETAGAGSGAPSDILPPPIKRKPGGEIEPTSRNLVMYGQSVPTAGGDPQTQAAIYNYYQMVNKQLEGITLSGIIADIAGKGTETIGKGLDFLGGLAGRQGFGRGFWDTILQGAGQKAQSVGQAIPGTVDAAFKSRLGRMLSPAAEYAAKQAIRSGLATAYLGAPQSIQAPDEYSQAIQGIIQSQLPEMPGVSGGVGRFGRAGQELAKRIPEIAAMGYDPMEYALNKMGAPAASRAIGRSASEEADLTMQAGGYLQRGRQKGIYK